MNIAPPQLAPIAPPGSGVTAAELLSNMMTPQRLPSQQPSFHHVRMPSAPTAPLSFGPNGPVQSIWSDDTTNSFAAVSKPSIPPVAGPAHNNPISQIPPQGHSYNYSQAAWPSQTASQALPNSHLPSSPNTLYSSQSSADAYYPLSVHNPSGGHIRAPSESAFLPRSQPYHPQSISHRYDPLRSPFAVSDQINIPTRGLSSLPPPSVYPDTIYSASPGVPFSSRDGRDQYGHSMQSHNLNMDRAFTAPFMTSSSIWGNPG